MLAAYHGHAALVRLLLEHGADPNRVNDRGQSPLAGAVFKGEDAVVEVCSPAPALQLDVEHESLLTEVQTLLEGGADPEHGQPSALECIGLFRQEEKWKAKFESAPGSGKATSS
jgi:ankyrin repeat protein